MQYFLAFADVEASIDKSESEERAIGPPVPQQTRHLRKGARTTQSMSRPNKSPELLVWSCPSIGLATRPIPVTPFIQVG